MICIKCYVSGHFFLSLLDDENESQLLYLQHIISYTYIVSVFVLFLEKIISSAITRTCLYLATSLSGLLFCSISTRILSIPGPVSS